VVGDRDVVIVLARPGTCEDATILDDDDRAHVARLRFAADRAVARASRAVQRRALSACAPGIEPSAWRFATDEAHGKPRVAGPAGAPPLVFSAANARGLVGCAVARGTREVGLDLEPWRDDAPRELIDRFFAPAERARLAALPSAEQPRRFIELWVLKEAYLKARGVGIAPIEHVAVELADGPPRLVLDPALGDDAATWQLALWTPTADHAAAVCVRRGDGPPLTLHHRWEPDPDAS
jgi:4'-phosphopantetheinyl transferase